MSQVRQITQFFEELAPRAYQESYDNSGLLIGTPHAEVKGVLFSLDCTEAVLAEALAKGCNLIVSHHPIIFKGLKQITGRNYVERTVIKAIKHDLNLYAIHTNLDNVKGGVNFKIAEKLGLQNPRILAPKRGWLKKLITFVPQEQTSQVLDALGQAGAGQIGEYKNCSFRVTGTGTFQPSDAANPFIGEAGKLEEVPENRLEVIFPTPWESRILRALKESHPYEEVAYYLHALDNENQDLGSGAIGDLPQGIPSEKFPAYVQEKMELDLVRYTPLPGQMIKKVALCGGTGSFLLSAARSQGAQAFLSADFKYHEFFEAEGQIMITDIGHYESERFTSELLHDVLGKTFPDIPRFITEIHTNPVRYQA